MDLALLFDGVQAGVVQLFSLSGILALVIGVFIGVIAGATPGISPAMAVALLVPFSFGMDPAIAFILFVAVYQAANYGGSVTAILINTPGTASAVVTAIDGYEMKKQGKASQALSVALCSSAFGGLIGACILILFTIPAAAVAIKFGPTQYFLLALFGIITVVSFSDVKIKALIAVFLGLIFSSVGFDSFTGATRLTFGLNALVDGIPLIPAMIGLFALSEVFANFFSNKEQKENLKLQSFKVLQYLKYYLIQIKSAVIGTLIGILPGAGATVASFISYAEAKRSSKNKDDFGKGAEQGIVASEAANSASVGGALIPLLALGIPGSATDAVLLGAFTLHGLVAGPALFQKSPEVVYSILISVLLANVLIVFAGKTLNKVWGKLTHVHPQTLFTFIFFLSVLGCFSLKNSLTDCYICLFFGVLGVILKRLKISAAALILGLVLGAIVEDNFRRMLILNS